MHYIFVSDNAVCHYADRHRTNGPADSRARSIFRADAVAAYIVALSDIVNVRSLTGGRHGYDFYARVPATEMHETTQRIVDLEFSIREQYGIHFRTYAIATAE